MRYKPETQKTNWNEVTACITLRTWLNLKGTQLSIHFLLSNPKYQFFTKSLNRAIFRTSLMILIPSQPNSLRFITATSSWSSDDTSKTVSVVPQNADNHVHCVTASEVLGGGIRLWSSLFSSYFTSLGQKLHISPWSLRETVRHTNLHGNVASERDESGSSISVISQVDS
jgi:hypothetical protein